MLENTISHKRKTNKCKKIVQYQSNERLVFSKLWPEQHLIYCLKELDKEILGEELSPCQCTGLQEVLQKHDTISPVENTTELFHHPILILVATANAKLIQHIHLYNIQGNDFICTNDDHIKTMNNTVDVNIPIVFKKYIQSTNISAVDNNSNSCSISNAQKILYLLLVENNLRSPVNNEIATRAVLIKVFQLIIDVNDSVHQAALSCMFSNWYFLNIAQGLRIKIILRSININTLAKIDMILCLILCKASTNRKVMLHFTSAIPFDEYNDLIYCLMLVHNTKGVSTCDDIIERITKEVKDNDEFGINFSDECTQTLHMKMYQDAHCNTEIEKDSPTNQDFKIPEQHSLNANIWLPKLCGESCDNKISFMTYILKCSCFNETLVDLDIAEKYVRIIYDIMLSPSFHKLFLKDLGKCLLSTFLNTVI